MRGQGNNYNVDIQREQFTIQELRIKIQRKKKRQEKRGKIKIRHSLQNRK